MSDRTGSEDADRRPEQHPSDELCFFCATDDQLLAGLHGQAPTTMHMQLPESACPNGAGIES